MRAATVLGLLLASAAAAAAAGESAGLLAALCTPLDRWPRQGRCRRAGRAREGPQSCAWQVQRRCRRCRAPARAALGCASTSGATFRRLSQPASQPLTSYLPCLRPTRERRQVPYIAQQRLPGYIAATPTRVHPPPRPHGLQILAGACSRAHLRRLPSGRMPQLGSPLASRPLPTKSLKLRPASSLPRVPLLWRCPLAPSPAQFRPPRRAFPCSRRRRKISAGPPASRRLRRSASRLPLAPLPRWRQSSPMFRPHPQIRPWPAPRASQARLCVCIFQGLQVGLPAHLPAGTATAAAAAAPSALTNQSTPPRRHPRAATQPRWPLATSTAPPSRLRRP